MALQQTPFQGENIQRYLDEAERLVGRLSFGLGKEALRIPEILDEVARRLGDAAARGNPPKAELAQFEAVQAGLRKEGRTFLREIGGVDALKEVRTRRQSLREHWWWYIDEELAAAQRLSALKMLRTGGILLAVLLVAALVYRLFFQPDPAVVAVVGAQQSADMLVTEGKLEDALQAVDVGLAQAPDSAELMLYKGLLLQSLGEEAQGTVLLEQAWQLMNDDEFFALQRGQTLIIMGRFEESIGVLTQCLQDYPQSARAYLIMGGAYEGAGDMLKAYQAYEMASQIGEEIDDPATSANARIKMGMLIQGQGLREFETIAP